MEITETRNGDTLLLDVAGRLDTSTSGVFEKELIGRIEAGESDLVLDFGRLDFVSSAGMRILLMAAKRIRAAKGRMVLCELSEEIYNVFQISGFVAVLTIFPSRSDALAAPA